MVIWTLPDQHSYVTTPGSAVLFPQLGVPTQDIPLLAPPESVPLG